jgi:hypothetical protein
MVTTSCDLMKPSRDVCTPRALPDQDEQEGAWESAAQFNRGSEGMLFAGAVRCGKIPTRRKIMQSCSTQNVRLSSSDN